MISLMIVSLAISEHSLFSFALGENNSSETSEQNAFLFAADKNYSAYLSKNDDLQMADSSIIVSGGDYYSEQKSGAERISEYEGKQNVLKWDSQKGTMTYQFLVEDDGFYELFITYMPIRCRGSDIRLGVKIDDSYPFDGLREIVLPRLWTDAGSIETDENGDELSPEQVELFTYTKQAIKDKEGIVVTPYRFALRSGIHTVTLEMKEEALILAEIGFEPPENVLPYDEVSKDYSNFKAYSGKPIVIQGEAAKIKTTNSLIGKSESNIKLTPSSAKNLMINYIGSTNWKTPGESLTWIVRIPKDGLYKLCFKYKQSEYINGISYRMFKIDNTVPFSEAEAIPFAYGTEWSTTELKDKNDSNCLIYLTSGTHEISMEVTLAETAALYARLKDEVTAIGDLYIKINMITGENPDVNRNYDLFKQISGFADQLEHIYRNLDSIASDMQTQSAKRSSSIIAAINNMSRVVKAMYDNPYTSHQYKSDYYSNYSSLSSWLYEMKSLPLSIDEILLTAPDYDLKQEKPSFFQSLLFSAERFLFSFQSDYSVITKNDKDTLTVWVNVGRDQAQIMQTLIRSSFTKTTEIDVNLQAVNATVVKGVLSGNPPDVALQMARTEPVNLAMRGVLYDMTQFKDYGEVVSRFQKTATVPYQYQGGCYALPETQSFYVMYYRSDIMEQLGLQVPKTWDDFLDCTATIQQKKMQVWLPYTQIATTTTVNTGIGGLSIFPTLMSQNNLSLYNSSYNGCSLNDTDSITVFNDWTDFYTEYHIPKEASFYNRFRVGTMPLGIESYTLYQQFNSAAPEIKGRWEIAPIPGIKQEDGTINHSSTGSGTGDSIIAGTGKESLAWEFLKWWTSAEIQLKYSNHIESILGAVGRVTTANVEAFSKMAWPTKDYNILISQWDHVAEIEEIPGSYYLTRSVDQAFWNVTNGMYNAKDAIFEWSHVADNEIERKIKEYGS